MKELSFEVSGQFIKRKDNIAPVAKCRNLYTAYFNFTTNEWTGTKTALFIQGAYAKSQIIDDDGYCIIPWEFFDSDTDTAGYVSVYCGNLVTANRAPVRILQSGYVYSDASAPPNPDIYQQILDKLDTDIISGGTFGDGLGGE